MEVVGALVGMLIVYLSYPDAHALGYIIGAISGGMVVALWKNPNANHKLKAPDMFIK